MLIHMTPNIRENDAQVLNLGQMYLALPPGESIKVKYEIIYCKKPLVDFTSCTSSTLVPKHQLPKSAKSQI